ncbi:MAG: hypothetical protein ACOC3C_08130 [Candidatus Thorarchaeota archaeon]
MLLFSSAAISLIAMVVIFRSWWKNRLLTSFLYVLAIACFAGMALDMYLDQVFMPFRNWSLNIGGETIWVSNLLMEFETNYRDGLLEDTGLVSSYDEFKDRTKRVLI